MSLMKCLYYLKVFCRLSIFLKFYHLMCSLGLVCVNNAKSLTEFHLAKIIQMYSFANRTSKVLNC